MEIITESAQATQELGAKIGHYLITQKKSVATVVLLSGDLGSGKTTFVQGFAKSLGIVERILSPTFILMRRYPLYIGQFTYFYHIDLYRTQTASDFESLGLTELFADTQALILIEWPERLNENPVESIMLKFKEIESEKRIITVSGLKGFSQ